MKLCFVCCLKGKPSVRCKSCFFCDCLDYFMEQFQNIDSVNSADNDIFWSKVDFYRDISLKTFGHLIGYTKISTAFESPKKRKLT